MYSMLSFAYIFFFNDTATTDIYTYCHTLSLHDALPISHGDSTVRSQTMTARVSNPNGRSSNVAGISFIVSTKTRIEAVSSVPRNRGRRSEEHTSELQSLMRISYAVFCLTQKRYAQN